VPTIQLADQVNTLNTSIFKFEEQSVNSNHQSVALIVGGSSGIGFETAKLLVTQGIKTVIVGNRSEKLEKAKASLAILGSALTLKANLYESNEVEQVIQFVQNHQQHIRYFVNAAGYFKPTAFLDHTPKDYATYADLNQATFFISQAVANNMRANGGGSIVHVGSMWAQQAIKATPSSAYSMAKAGLHSLTQHMAMELAQHKIRVNAIAPAVVKTPIYEAFIDKDAMDETLASFNAFHPIGRIGSAAEVAKTIEFLLGEQSAWVTGSVWNIDGGVMAGRN
jgi:NAD(P)-dependent dehydrogenase (short-subunit alcohol dehydrogenase family)